jgi:hypothetical protein
VTNAPRPSDEITQEIVAMGVPEDAFDALVSSGEVTRDIITQYEGLNVYRLGPTSDDGLFEGINVNFGSLDEAHAIVCSDLEYGKTPEDYREAVIGIFQSNRAVAVSIMLMIHEAVYNVLSGNEKQALDAMVQAGAGVCLDEVGSLRLSFQQLADRGVKYIKVDAGEFIADPLQFSDYHRADIADYVERFGVGLIMDNITQEDQVLELLDDKIPFAQGKHIAPASPVRPDLAGQTKADTRLAVR